jgi:hypothetical protein
MAAVYPAGPLPIITTFSTSAPSEAELDCAATTGVPRRPTTMWPHVDRFLETAGLAPIHPLTTGTGLEFAELSMPIEDLF